MPWPPVGRTSQGKYARREGRAKKYSTGLPPGGNNRFRESWVARNAGFAAQGSLNNRPRGDFLVQVRAELIQRARTEVAFRAVTHRDGAGFRFLAADD